MGAVNYFRKTLHLRYLKGPEYASEACLISQIFNAHARRSLSNVSPNKPKGLFEGIHPLQI